MTPMGEPTAIMHGYECEELCAQGETGDLYRARHLATSQTVALKLVCAALARDPSFRAAFRMQAQALCSLRHPHILPIYEAATNEHGCFVAMEWASDGTLRDLIARDEVANVPVDERVAIVWQIAVALQEAHQRGFIHGSVTPDDVFLFRTPRGLHAKLADFGLGWLAIHNDAMIERWNESLTYAMAPERCKGLDLDERSDIYAVGVILYEVLSGQTPFETASLDTAVFHHVYSQPRSLIAIAPELPPDLAGIAMRCLAKEPGERFVSAAALAEALVPFVGARSQDAALPAQPIANEPQPAPPPVEEQSAPEAAPSEPAPAHAEAVPPAATPEPPSEMVPAPASATVAPEPAPAAPRPPRIPLALVGSTVAGFRLEAYLGETETGDVYRGRNPETKALAAVKLIRDTLAHDRYFAAQFDEQMPVLQALQHPNLVSIQATGRENDMSFVVMEWLPDGTLRNLLQRRGEGALPLRLSVELACQAAVGLEYAHAQRLVHGCIKPNNLLLQRHSEGAGPAYTLKIGDLGLAWLALGSATDEPIWPDTLLYAMPPERCQGLELDHRADLYALGAVLYELVTGSQPFEARTLETAVYRHVYTKPTPPRQMVPEIPAALEAIILRCLAKNPAARFASAGALAAELGQLLDGQALVPSPPPQPALAAAPVDGPFTPRVSAIDQYGRMMAARDLSGEGVQVGRAPDNDIVLLGEQVAAHHLQIDWNGSAALATNIANTGDVQIGETALAQGVTTAWQWHVPIRVGPYWLRVEAIKATDAAAPVEPRGAFADEHPAAAPVPAVAAAPNEVLSDRIAIAPDQEELAITPGRPTTFKLALANMGSTVDHFTVSVEGIPAAWLAGTAPTVQLNPGKQSTLALNVLVPQTPEHRAGIYPVTIRVRSREQPHESNIVPATWTVQPFANSSFELRPKRLKRRVQGRYRIAIKNLGNAAARYHVLMADEEETLLGQFVQDQVSLEPGATLKTDLVVRPQRWIWYGRSTIHRFTASVNAVDADAPTIPTAAQFEQLPIIPRGAVVLLTLALVCLAVFMWWNARPVISDLATAPAQPVAGEPFRLMWQVNNATELELNVNGTAIPIDANKKEILFQGASSVIRAQLTAKNMLFARAVALHVINPLAPTPLPTTAVLPTPTTEPTQTAAPTDAPPPSPVPPTAAPVLPTATPTIVPTPTSQTACAPGRTAEIIVRGTARQGYLVSFDGRVVSGGRIDDDGSALVRLGPFDEPPGRYPVEVRDRTTNTLLRAVTCVVP